MIKKLRTQFITISIIAVSAVLLLLFAAVNAANFISFNSKLNNTLDIITENGGEMPHFAREKVPDNQKPQSEDNRFAGKMNEETSLGTRYFAVIFDADGKKLQSNLQSIAAVTDTDTDAYIAIALQHGEGYGFTENYKYKVTAMQDGGYLAVFVHDERDISSALTLLFASLGATAACIGLISLIIVLFSKKAMRPMIEADKKQKQFITDASHELKTPITVIGTSLSVLEMEVGKQKWIDKAKVQCDKLRDLVNSLVTLSRMDEHETPMHRETFEISTVLAEVADSFADFAQSKGHPLQTDIEQGIRYCGDAYMCRQLTSVLLENAIKYASENTPIRFCLKARKKGIIISTENACDHLDPTQLDKLFDRFYRADKARSGDKAGFGIGLSLARSISEAHKGSIAATAPDDHTIVFTAKLK